MPGLFKLLFRTFITSILIGAAANSIWYAYIYHHPTTVNYSHIISLILELTLVLNIELLVMSLPVLFLQYPQIWGSRVTRLLLYFAGPVVFLATVCVMKINPLNRTVYIITAVIYILVHTFFYFRLIKKTN
jgi:hypothetical protein